MSRDPALSLEDILQPAITHCSSLQFKHFLNSSEPQGNVISYGGTSDL